MEEYIADCVIKLDYRVTEQLSPRRLRIIKYRGAGHPSDEFPFVILESMIRQLDPDHDYLGSFREEISRLTAQHFSLARIKDKTSKLARELERLMNEAPGDTRRILRRFAEGNLGRLQAPAVEALGGRVSRNLERLTGAIASAALVIGGVMLALGPPMGAWHHILGETMVIAGISGTLIICIGALRRDRGRR